jgi:hypothetical protein
MCPKLASILGHFELRIQMAKMILFKNENI